MTASFGSKPRFGSNPRRSKVSRLSAGKCEFAQEFLIHSNAGGGNPAGDSKSLEYGRVRLRRRFEFARCKREGSHRSFEFALIREREIDQEIHLNAKGRDRAGGSNSLECGK